MSNAKLPVKEIIEKGEKAVAAIEQAERDVAARANAIRENAVAEGRSLTAAERAEREELFAKRKRVLSSKKPLTDAIAQAKDESPDVKRLTDRFAKINQSLSETVTVIKDVGEALAKVAQAAKLVAEILGKLAKFAV